MISILGSDQVIKSIYMLSRPYLAGAEISTVEQLRSPYLKFLSQHQPRQVLNNSSDPVAIDESATAALSGAFGHSKFNDLSQENMLGDQVEADEKLRLKALVRDGYAVLASRSPEVKAIFDLAIHSIFFVKSKTNKRGHNSFGGSSSGAIGSIWVSGQGDFNKFDISEFLLHELTHHLLFLAERCENQFHYDAIALPENYAQSAILNYRRPLDKVVHSIVVSTEIILARDSFLGNQRVSLHPSTEVMLQQTILSIGSVFDLKNLDDLLTPWSIDIVKRCNDILKSCGKAA
jgi:hypothetical protein